MRPILGGSDLFRGTGCDQVVVFNCVGYGGLAGHVVVPGNIHKQD